MVYITDEMQIYGVYEIVLTTFRRFGRPLSVVGGNFTKLPAFSSAVTDSCCFGRVVRHANGLHHEFYQVKRYPNSGVIHPETVKMTHRSTNPEPHRYTNFTFSVWKVFRTHCLGIHAIVKTNRVKNGYLWN